SQDRPRDSYETVVAAEAGAFLQLPDGWATQYSKLKNIERPIGEAPPRYLSSEAWSLTLTALGQRIWLETPALTGEEIGVVFTAPHAVDAGEDTVPQSDRVAVACFAASLLCEQLATLTAGQGAPTIEADSVDYGAKSTSFASRARKFAERYYNHLGIEPKRNVAAGTVVVPRERDSRGEPRLFKGRRA
ncbi:MAG: hypothetical protein WD100_02975, partial [Tistlia sp.]